MFAQRLPVRHSGRAPAWDALRNEKFIALVRVTALADRLAVSQQEQHGERRDADRDGDDGDDADREEDEPLVAVAADLVVDTEPILVLVKLETPEALKPVAGIGPNTHGPEIALNTEEHAIETKYDR